MNRTAIFRVSSASPSVQTFIRNLYRGIEPYFSMPEETSWEELRKILYWKAFDAKRQELEKIWGPRFEVVLKESGIAIGKVYETTLSVERCEAAVDARMMPALRKLMGACDLETERIFLARLKDSLRIKKDDVFGDPVDPLEIPEMIGWNIDTLADKVTNISISTKFAIKRTISEGVKAGKSIPEIVDMLEAAHAFSRYRSYVIARTEIIASSNAATHFGMSHFIPANNLTKDWLSTGDKRTRKTHIKAGENQKNIEHEKPFEVGGSLLMFPGDGSLGASAKETIQCRCTTLYYAKRSSIPPVNPPPVNPPPGPKPKPIRIPKPKPPKPPSLPKPPKPKPPKPSPPPPKPDPITLTPQEQGFQLRQELEEKFGKRMDALKDLSNEAAEQHRTWGQAKTFWGQGSTGPGSYTKREALRRYREDLKNDIFDALRLPDNVKGQLSLTFDKSSHLLGTKGIQDVKDAVAFLNSIIRDQGIASVPTNGTDIMINGLKHGARAYASKGSGKFGGIFVAADGPSKTIIHEMGHFLEYNNNGLKKAVMDLLKKRSQGEKLTPLKKLLPGTNYPLSEKAWKDHFIHPYIGKDYKGYASEIVSMTMELLFDDPVTLLRLDPELFDVVMGHLRRFQ